MKQLVYDDRLCGQGKTTDTHKLITESSERWYLASPSIDLNEEQGESMKGSSRIDTKTIGRETTVKESVAKEIYEEATKVICTTHASLKGLIQSVYGRSLDDPLGLHLVLDEALEGAIKETAIHVGEKAGNLLESMLTFKPWSQSPNIFEVSAKEGGDLEALAAGTSKCDILRASDELRAVAKRVVDPLYITLVPRASYENFRSTLTEKGAAHFASVSLIRPKFFALFKSSRCLSAFFTDTEFALAMQFQGVALEDESPSSPDGYDNSERLHIHYFTDDVWTKTLRVRQDIMGVSNMDKVVGFIGRELGGGEGFIFNANVDDRKLLERIPGAELVVSTHGRNDLRDIKNAAFLGSMNIGPHAGRVITQLGIDREKIDKARGVLAGYQFFMRSNLRVMDSIDPVDIYCCDRRMVDFMLDVFPDAQVTKHDDIGLQYENLKDARDTNGGSRKGAGRKSVYPGYFTEADKKAYQRSGRTLGHSEWHGKNRFKKAG